MDHYEYKIRQLPEAISTDPKKTLWKVGLQRVKIMLQIYPLLHTYLFIMYLGR